MDEFDKNWYGADAPSESDDPEGYNILEDMANIDLDCWSDYEPEDLDANLERSRKERIEREHLEAIGENKLRDEGWLPIAAETGSIVPNDVIRFVEAVWDKDFHKRTMLGTRTNTVRITRESYSKRVNRRLYIEVIDSSGTEPMEKGRKTWRLPDTLCHNEYLRRRWENESERDEAVARSKEHCDDLLDVWCTERERLAEREIDALTAGLQTLHKPTASSKPNSSDDNDSDDETYHVEPLSEQEQQWADSEWYEDVDWSIYQAHIHERWLLDAGWKPLSGTSDEPVLGDIIRFSNPEFTGRYPRVRYCGSSIVIAEVVKIGRKYYHLRLLACKGNEPWSGSGNMFRKQFGTVNGNGVHRLRWKHEISRMDRYRKETGVDFSSFGDYMEYIGEQTRA